MTTRKQSAWRSLRGILRGDALRSPDALPMERVAFHAGRIAFWACAAYGALAGFVGIITMSPTYGWLVLAVPFGWFFFWWMVMSTRLMIAEGFILRFVPRAWRPSEHPSASAGTAQTTDASRQAQSE